jgi:hypothetical protein
MLVAWVRVVSAMPEQEAWTLLSAWAGPAGLLDDRVAHPVFGFNNPPPAAGSPEYGFEFWVGVDAHTTPPEPIALKEFPGGLYAVTSCPVGPTCPGRGRPYCGGSTRVSSSGGVTLTSLNGLPIHRSQLTQLWWTYVCLWRSRTVERTP